MSWAAITEDDLRSAINDAEDEAIRAGALSAGQADPYEIAKAQVTGLFLGAIRSGGTIQTMPTDGTLLPAVAIFHAIAKLRFRLLTRFASELLDEDRRTENKEAEAWLNAVRRGVEKIEPWDATPGAIQQPAISLLSDHERQATRQNLSGL